MIKAIVFDLDNTLIDFMKIKKTSCEAAADAMIKAGLKVNKRRLLQEIYSVYKTKGYEYQRVFQDVLRKLSGKVDWGVLAYGIVAYKRVKEEMLFPYPDVAPTLKRLRKKYKLAVLSDAPRMQALIRIAAMDLVPYFDVIVTYDDTKQKKPHQLPFQILLKRLNLRPEEVLFVGDSMRRDIFGAKTAGMKTVFARYGGNKVERAGIRPDYTIEHFKDLLGIA